MQTKLEYTLEYIEIDLYPCGTDADGIAISRLSISVNPYIHVLGGDCIKYVVFGRYVRVIGKGLYRNFKI